MTSGGNATTFLYDGDDLVAEYNSGGTLTARYVHGPGAGDDPLVWYDGSTRRYLTRDQQGSIVATSEAGGTVQVNSYDEYGIPAVGNVGRFQYTGQAWLAELGLYYYKARIYSPTLGRFLQTDPIGYGGGMNMYAYVGNDPVNFTDPSGLCRLMGWVKTSLWPSGKVAREILGTWWEDCKEETDSSDGGVGGNQLILVTAQVRRPNPCDQPAAVHIDATLTLSGAVVGFSSIMGTLTDVTTGESKSFVGRGPVYDEGGGMVGGALGWFSLSGTLNGGFDVLNRAFQIRFWTAGTGPASFGSATIINREGREIGQIKVNSTWAIPIGGAVINLDGITTTQGPGASCR